MNRTKRECLMQRLPAPADILALIPAQEDATRTAVICAHGSSLMLGATPEHVLACLAEREDKALRLIRRNAARLMARRRNIILPILHGCVLTPIKMYHMRRGGIGYVNTAYAALVLRRRGTGSDIALQSAVTSSTACGRSAHWSATCARGAPSTTNFSTTCAASFALPRTWRREVPCISPPSIV